MMNQPFFSDKTILVIDQSPKQENDRTWCFWETGAGEFEAIIHHSWKQIDFYAPSFSARFDIAPYVYKMIRSIDFYTYVLNKAKQRGNIHFAYGKVQALSNQPGKAVVIINDQQISADYVFNSIFFGDITNPLLFTGKGNYFLLQHFKGWVIETEAPVFDKEVATFMDFRVSQQEGTTFAYLLPVAGNKALVEYTLFSESVLAPQEYDIALEVYITRVLKISSYKISEQEFGVIPMTNFPFSKGEGNIVNIGTAGGNTKPSSGYTFRFIQKHTAEIVQALIKNEDPHVGRGIAQRRFAVYDNTLLNILTGKKQGGDEIFASLFKKNTPQQVFRFLDNESNLSDELKIMRSVRTDVFLPAALRELFR